MIGTVTLNPCIDRTVVIPSLAVGDMNRMTSSRRDASGKGINVSIALSDLGTAVRSCGFIFEDGRDFLISSLRRKGIEMEGITVQGALRENIKILDEKSRLTTEINQSGEYVSEDKWEAFIDFFRQFVDGLDLLVLSGSVPPGIPKSAYKDLMGIASESGVPVFLDAEGELLLEGLEERPLMIKPNLYELRRTFGCSADSPEAVIKEAELIRKRYGVEYAFVSLGSLGAVLSCGDGAYIADPLRVDVRSAQGAGDAFVAGVSKAYADGLDAIGMLSCGMAASASAIEKEGTEMCDALSFSAHLPTVRIREV